MDSIDITDSAFSLNIPDVNEIIPTNVLSSDYSTYIYIGIASLILLIAFFIFKYYQNKKNNQQNNLDCPGGFCPMNGNVGNT